MLKKILLMDLLLINAAGFTLMLVDKIKAKRNLWRIPEATLIGVAAIGGSIGAIAGMKLFRHKTLHAKFYIGLPVILALQIVAAMCLLFLLK